MESTQRVVGKAFHENPTYKLMKQTRSRRLQELDEWDEKQIWERSMKIAENDIRLWPRPSEMSEWPRTI